MDVDHVDNEHKNRMCLILNAEIVILFTKKENSPT